MPRPLLTADTLARQAAIGQVALSPDGEWVVFSRRVYQGLSDVIQLWVVPYAGGRPRRLTDGPAQDSHPRVTADGTRVVYLSAPTAGAAQVCEVPLAGGRPRALTAVRGGVDAYDLSADERRLALLISDEAPLLDVASPARGASPTARVIRRADWRRDGVGEVPHAAHIHLAEVPERGRPAPPRRLTSGSWSAARPRFCPDGRHIAFVADPGPDRDIDPHPQVWRVAVDGGSIERVTRLPGSVSRFGYEPDGALIVCATHTRIQADEDQSALFLLGADGSGSELSAGLDCHVCECGLDTDLTDWVAADDGCGRLTIVADRGRTRLLRFADDGPIDLLGHVPDAMVDGRAEAAGRVVVSMTLGVDAAEVYAVEAGRARRLTTNGGAWLRRHARPTVEELMVPGPGGAIRSFVVSPPGAGPEPRATILALHGGPAGAWGPTPTFEPLLLASQGYRVALANGRGSFDQGYDWARALRGRWGEVDAEDQHAVLDHLIERGLADPARLGCVGGSYGGFLVNWLLATSDRFRAGVSENGVANQISAWAESDWTGVYNAASGYGDTLTEEGVAQLWKTSPLRHVATLTTPLLLLQGADDLRCPKSDAEQLFVALRTLRREVEYVLYPESSHYFRRTGRIDRRIDRHRRALAWFQRFMPA